MDNVISVSQFSNYVKQIFLAEEMLHNILIYGEVSGFNVSRGIAYFNIKDEEALLPCVKFGVDESGYLPKEGEMVLVRGSPNYYVKGGRFSFNVTKIEPYGKGVLYQQFLEMKEKLEKAGLFNKEYKKALPQHIKKIGVVTAQTGAVIHDIIDITGRRNPLLNILLYPAKVQGIGAENTIVKGIETLDKTDVDVIIVARGGGSIEDLSCFNTEIVAYAIYNANKPVISAVGHETDFTIADMVADVRAPTPSAAAELVSVDMGMLIERLNKSIKKLELTVCNKYEDNLMVLNSNYNELFGKTLDVIRRKNMPLRELVLKLIYSAKNKQNCVENKFNVLSQKLEAKNPVTILRMGYIKAEFNNMPIRKVTDLSVGQNLKLKFIDGEADCVVNNLVKKGD